MTAFRLSALAALILLVLLGLFHREAPVPDPTAALIAHLRATGHTISKPRTLLWGTPAIAFSVDDCPAPVDAVLFDVDEILGPGIMPAVRAVEHGTMQVSYGGVMFGDFDRAVLYRLRLRNLLHGTLADPPVILLFWQAGCEPKPVL